MTDADLFEAVAARRMTPSEAADRMLAADAEAGRPAWMPPRAWRVLRAAGRLLAQAFGG